MRIFLTAPSAETEAMSVTRLGCQWEGWNEEGSCCCSCSGCLRCFCRWWRLDLGPTAAAAAAADAAEEEEAGRVGGVTATDATAILGDCAAPATVRIPTASGGGGGGGERVASNNDEKEEEEEEEEEGGEETKEEGNAQSLW